MKYSTLKENLKHVFSKPLALSIIAALSLCAFSVRANELKEAHRIVHEVKGRLVAFFDTKNKESFKTHVSKLAPIVASIDALTAHVEMRYKNEGTEKYRIMHEICKMVKNALNNIYNALNQKYKNALSLIFSASKIIKKYAHLGKSLINKIDKLEQHLNDQERHEIDRIRATLDSFEIIVPKSKFTCLSRLNKRLKIKN